MQTVLTLYWIPPQQLTLKDCYLKQAMPIFKLKKRMSIDLPVKETTACYHLPRVVHHDRAHGRDCTSTHYSFAVVGMSARITHAQRRKQSRNTDTTGYEAGSSYSPAPITEVGQACVSMPFLGNVLSHSLRCHFTSYSDLVEKRMDMPCSAGQTRHLNPGAGGLEPWEARLILKQTPRSCISLVTCSTIKGRSSPSILCSG